MNSSLRDLLGPDILLHYDINDPTSLFTDTSGTVLASDGSEVKCIKPQLGSAFQNNLTNSNGPIYRSNYSGSGYSALEFDGVNDLLTGNTNFSTGQELFVLAVFTWIGPYGTLWSRGNSGSHFLRAYCHTDDDELQNASVTIVSAGLATGKRVTAFVSGSGQTQIDSLGFSTGNRNSLVSASLSNVLTLGALNIGSFSQFGNFVLHEILFIGRTCEWGQVLRAAKLLRLKWGVSDPNAIPQKTPDYSHPLSYMRTI